MAETALGMATTLVGGALGVASSAAREEVGLLLGVQGDIWFINDELKMMQAFLKAADGARKNSGVLKAYLEQIRDLAYDIEDCFEEDLIDRLRTTLKEKRSCISVLNTMEDLSNEEKVKAFGVFKDAQHREIFISAEPVIRLMWLRSAMDLEAFT